MKTFNLFFLAIVIFNCFILNVSAQSWYVPTYFTRTISNYGKSKCIRTNGIPDSPIFLGDCDDSVYTYWKFNVYFNGHCYKYYSEANPDYCINIDSEVLTLKNCTEANELCYGYHDSINPDYENMSAYGYPNNYSITFLFRSFRQISKPIDDEAMRYQ